MKKMIFIAFAICCMISCNKKEENAPFGDDDTPKLTITLYDKPPHIIQEYILGRWEVISISGGLAGTSYLENWFMTFSDSTYSYDNDGSKDTVHFVWKEELHSDFPNFGDSTYVYGIWDLYENDVKHNYGMYFSGIENDILSVVYYVKPNIADFTSGARLVRVK